MPLDVMPGRHERGGPERVNILGVGVMPMTIRTALAALDTWHESGRRDYVCCVSVHGLVLSQREPEVRASLNGAGLAMQDGMPLVWWSRRVGFPDAGRVCGPDLMDAACANSLAHGYRHYFYGGTQVALDRLVSNLTARHPGLVVAGYHAPPFRALSAEEDAADIARINATRPDFVWVGLGMPKQEKWMAAHVGQVHATALMGVGAAFDFHAGTKARAPVWMQRSGTEWIFRLACEPRRLARRYLVDNSIFLAHAARQALGLTAYARDW